METLAISFCFYLVMSRPSLNHVLRHQRHLMIKSRCLPLPWNVLSFYWRVECTGYAHNIEILRKKTGQRCASFCSMFSENCCVGVVLGPERVRSNLISSGKRGPSCYLRHFSEATLWIGIQWIVARILAAQISWNYTFSKTGRYKETWSMSKMLSFVFLSSRSRWRLTP